MTGLKNDKSHLCPLHSTAAAIANYVLLLVVGFLTGATTPTPWFLFMIAFHTEDLLFLVPQSTVSDNSRV